MPDVKMIKNNIARCIFCFTRSSRGFTLIEIVIVAAIMAVLATVAVSHYGAVYRRAVLETSVEQIQSVLRLARQRAIAQQDGVEWGVHFTNPAAAAGFYEIYRTATYSSGNVTERYGLEPLVIFITPASGASTTVLFARRTGEIAAVVNIIVSLLPAGSMTRTIRISPVGVIEIL
jgi:prepilin-type N-terminal cleavage/methylation domain-containing protein